MGLVRFHAAEWHIDRHKLGVLGFSSGGHLSAAISTYFAKRLYPAVDAADKESCRPDFAVAMYPGHLSLSAAEWDANQGAKKSSRVEGQGAIRLLAQGRREGGARRRRTCQVQIVVATHAGMTTEEFEQTVRDWLATAKPPKTGRRYTEMVYQPMLKLLAYLRANGFKTFIVSVGGVDFMRVFPEQVYGIPPEQIVGSTAKVKFKLRGGKPVLVKLPEIQFVDDKDGKPVGFHQFIGRRPIAAFGNSDGDLPMLLSTAAGSGARFCLYVHHTDAEREWAYDRQSSIGRLAKGLDEVNARGWTVVSMKNDWKQIFAFDK